MKRTMKMFAFAAVVAVFVGGCASTGDKGAQCAQTQQGLAPLKVGVYADKGPSGIGAVEWFRLVEESPDMELKLLDGKAVRAGGLDGLDLLVMPGGNSKVEFDTLGTNGVEKMKAFVRNGGGYIGTCAGCCLLMDGPEKRARMMPWNTCGSESGTLFLNFTVNAKGASALGIKEGNHVMRYHGGPCLWPTTNVIADAKMEAWGTFDSQVSLKGKTGKNMHGAVGLVGGTYGKGKVFVTSAHPEYFNSTLYIVKGAFKYVTGRDVTFPQRPRKWRALAVGFVTSGIAGVDCAATALDIAAEDDFDLVLIDGDGIKQRRLDHLDVLVLPTARLKKNTEIVDEIKAFAARGGKVVAFGEGVSMMPEGGIKTSPRAGVVKTLRGLMQE